MLTGAAGVDFYSTLLHSGVFRERPFPRAKAPQAKKDWWPALQIIASLCAGSFEDFSVRSLRNTLFTLQEMSPNVSQAQTLAGGTN